MNNNTLYIESEKHALSKAVLFIKLTKPRLSLLVVFSALIGYILAGPVNINWMNVFILAVGSYFITSSANTINQIIEVDLDKLMKRTKNRPLPMDNLSKLEASIFAFTMAVGGFVILLYYFNFLTALLSLISLVLYAFAYTPLKRVSSIAVFVGAIPGALPPLLGWLAFSNSITTESLCLFGIQFMWQFPHFWAIAWVLDEDYQRAGFKLLPSGGKRDFNTAFQIMIYTLLLIPLALLPYQLGITGLTSAYISLVCGVLFLALTFSLMKNPSKEAALKIMFASFFYLPIVQIALVLDKI